MPGLHLTAILTQLVLGVPFSKTLRVILLVRESWESSAGSFLPGTGVSLGSGMLLPLLAAPPPPFCAGDPLAWSILRISSRSQRALPQGAPPPQPCGRSVGSLSSSSKGLPLETIYNQCGSWHHGDIWSTRGKLWGLWTFLPQALLIVLIRNFWRFQNGIFF